MAAQLGIENSTIDRRFWSPVRTSVSARFFNSVTSTRHPSTPITRPASFTPRSVTITDRGPVSGREGHAQTCIDPIGDDLLDGVFESGALVAHRRARSGYDNDRDIAYEVPKHRIDESDLPSSATWNSPTGTVSVTSRRNRSL